MTWLYHQHTIYPTNLFTQYGHSQASMAHVQHFISTQPKTVLLPSQVHDVHTYGSIPSTPKVDSTSRNFMGPWWSHLIYDSGCVCYECRRLAVPKWTDLHSFQVLLAVYRSHGISRYKSKVVVHHVMDYLSPANWIIRNQTSVCMIISHRNDKVTRQAFSVGSTGIVKQRVQ